MSAEKMIDINCDMGESHGNVVIGNDDAIFPYITSCNIACGFHGGDPVQMERTVKGALQHGVQIGAHPSYPDRENFGRKKMQIPENELKALLRYQIEALIGVAHAQGGRVLYVKPHGALYNTAAEDANEARVIVEAILSINDSLALMGLAGSMMEKAAAERNVRFIPEAFADRRYQRSGTLVPRVVTGAIISDPDEAAAQVLSIVLDQTVTSIEGIVIPVKAQSICVHGDHVETLEILKAIDAALKANNIGKIAR